MTTNPAGADACHLVNAADNQAPAVSPDGSMICAGCGLTFPVRLLACPGCRRLVHGATLQRLAGEAEAATANGDPQAALVAWRQALPLLPIDSRQRAQIASRIETLGRATAASGAGSPPRPSGGRGGFLVGLGALGTLLWKFKFIALLVASKAKFLLLGFTKLGTLLSAMAAFGVYWTLWGWKFALGFVLSIYVHEMGHVAALRRFGIPATAPMFIPGLGAFVRLKQNPANAHEDARTALAGPLWGMGAAIVAAGIGYATDSAFWFSLAHAGALLNLFNLVPLGTLDGGRAFRALDRRQRWLLCAILGGLMLMGGEPLLILLLLAAGFRALSKDAPTEPDRGAFMLFVAILAILCLLARIPAPAARPA